MPKAPSSLIMEVNLKLVTEISSVVGEEITYLHYFLRYHQSVGTHSSQKQQEIDLTYVEHFLCVRNSSKFLLILTTTLWVSSALIPIFQMWKLRPRDVSGLFAQGHPGSYCTNWVWTQPCDSWAHMIKKNIILFHYSRNESNYTGPGLSVITDPQFLVTCTWTFLSRDSQTT